MAQVNVMREYLVKLGFAPDLVSFGQFQNVLRDSESLVDNKTMAMASSFLKFQGAVTSGFAAAGAAALGVVDHVIMADQEYRLLGLRMFTTTNTARTLKVAMDALDVDLGSIRWDKEIAGRFKQLAEDQQVMMSGLGAADFEKTVLRLRDIRQEFVRLGVAFKTYLPMFLTKDFQKIFGVNIDDIDKKFHNLSEYVIHHMPEISDWFANRLAPIMTDVKDVLGTTVERAKDLGTTFSNIVGLLSGDKSIEGTSFSFDNLAKAIQHTVDWLTVFTKSMLDTEGSALHFTNAATFLAQGDKKQAQSEFDKALSYVTPESGLTGGLMAGGALAAVAGTGALPIIAGTAVVGLEMGTIVEDARKKSQHFADIAQMAPGYAFAAAQKTGLDLKWLLAMEAFETGGFQSKAAGFYNLGGIRQNLSSNPEKPDWVNKRYADLGEYNTQYIATLQDKIKRWGHVPKNLTEFVQMLYGEGDQSYVQDKNKNAYLAGMVEYIAKMTPTPGEHHTTVNINMQGTNLQSHEIAHAAKTAVQAAWDQKNQRWLQEWNSQMFPGQ